VATKILLLDKKNTQYLFTNNGQIFINNEFKGLGKLVTPINKISLRNSVKFILEGQKFLTAPLKACLIDD